jgi:hypothetical protein
MRKPQWTVASWPGSGALSCVATHRIGRTLLSLILLSLAPALPAADADTSPVKSAVDEATGARAGAEVSQHLVYPPPQQFDVEKTVQLTEEPSLDSLETYLREELTKANPQAVIRRTVRDGFHLRLEATHLQQLVLEKKYWEYLLITAYLDRSGRTEIDANCPEEERVRQEVLASLQKGAVGQSPEPPEPPGTFQELLDAERRAFIAEQCKPRPIYSVSVVVDGHFAAGGAPPAVAGYTDMMKDHFKELEAFAGSLATGYEVSMQQTRAPGKKWKLR